MYSLRQALALILAFTTAASLATPTGRAVNVKWWPPLGGYYYRCKSPNIVEVSEDQEVWVPSSVCMAGTCCSSLASSPRCTKDACELAVQEKEQEVQSGKPQFLGKNKDWPLGYTKKKPSSE
jgi:hypothetical protein